MHPNASLKAAFAAFDINEVESAFAAGGRLEWSEYSYALAKAVNARNMDTVNWFKNRVLDEDVKKLFFPENHDSVASCWIALNAEYYHPGNPLTCQVTDALLEMFQRARLLNAPVVKRETSDERLIDAARGGWRLLHCAAVSNNTRLIQKLLSLGAHPDGFDPAILTVNRDGGRWANWAWTPLMLARPNCAPAFLCPQNTQALAALAEKGADLSTLGRPGPKAPLVSIASRSGPFIRQAWAMGHYQEALDLAAFWLDRAAPRDFEHLGSDRELCPAEGMLRLKTLAPVADRDFFAEAGPAFFDRLRFSLTPFERLFGRSCMGALREADFFAFNAALKAAASSEIPFDQWRVGQRHILILALSSCLSLPARAQQETLFGARLDRDQQAAAILDLACSWGGSRSLFEPLGQEPGSLAHYCALGFGEAPNRVCAQAARELSQERFVLQENPLNWALWSNNDAALAAWTTEGSASPSFISLFPGSKHPMELALDRGRLDFCKSLAQSGVSLDAPSSRPLKTLRDLALEFLDGKPAALHPERAPLIRELLAVSEKNDIGQAVSPSRRPTL